MKPEFWMGVLVCVCSVSYAFRARKMRGDPARQPHRWLIEAGKGVSMFIGGLALIAIGLKN